MKVHQKKEARIDPNVIIKEKRSLNIQEREYLLLNALVVNCGDNKTTSVEDSICTSIPKLTKTQKRREIAKKKKAATTAVITSTEEVITVPLPKEDNTSEDITLSNGTVIPGPIASTSEVVDVCTTMFTEVLKEEDTELGNLLFNSEIKASTDNFGLYGYDSPLQITNQGLFWKNGSRMPLILNEFQRIVFELFGIGTKTSASDVQGFDITVFPPSTDRDVITTVHKSNDSVMARIVMVLGSPENMIFRAQQDKIDADCDVSFFKDQSIMLGFGICNTVSFTFNNSGSYVHKIKPDARGITRNKCPNKRLVIIIDYISDEKTISREFKQAVRDAANKDHKKAPYLRNSTLVTDKDTVIEMASKRAEKEDLNLISEKKETINEGEGEDIPILKNGQYRKIYNNFRN
jgi:hypothetical protein